MSVLYYREKETGVSSGPPASDSNQAPKLRDCQYVEELERSSGPETSLPEGCLRELMHFVIQCRRVRIVSGL